MLSIPPMSSTSLAAAGRVLSQKNANRLKSVFAEIANILMAANILDAETLASLTSDSSTSEPGQTDESVQASDSETTVAAQAEDFKTQVKRVTWHDRFRSTIKIFARRFMVIHDSTDVELERDMGTSVAGNRRQAIAALIEDLQTVLTELSSDHPGATDDMQARWEGMEAPYTMNLSGKEQEVNHLTVSFDCPIQAGASKRKGRSKGNRHPISGVLFRIDEPSEAVPAKGPGLPLYIPHDVAASVVNSVSGLPLDAADNLSQHADEDITGVMLSAEVKEKDFVVHGFLWEASRPTKVQAIADNQERLGMSMTADAWGHESDIDGRKVFWVDRLDLKGGNILYAEKATFQQTRLIAAEKYDPDQLEASGRNDVDDNLVPESIAPSPTAIAASADPLDPILHSDDLGESDAMDPAMQQQLTQITDTLNAMKTDIMRDVTGLANTVQTLAGTVQTVQASVKTLEDERQQTIAAAQAQTAQHQKEQEQKQLVELITQTVDQVVAKRINPSGQPQRRTVPLAAQAASEPQANPESMSIQLQLANLDGQIQAIRNRPAGMYDGVEEMRLLDKRRELETQLQFS